MYILIDQKLNHILYNYFHLKRKKYLKYYFHSIHIGNY